MSQIYVLRNPEIAKRMIAQIKMLAGPAASAGRPLMVEIGEYQEKRSNEQNRFYWQLLTDIAEQAEVDGKRFSKEAWHEHMRDQFAPKQDAPKGLVPMSTAQMSKQQFQEFCTRVEVFAVTELSVEFAAV